MRGIYCAASGIDVTPWPHRPEDGVIDWALAEVLRSRGVNCVIDVGGNRGQLRAAAARTRLHRADRLVRAFADRTARSSRRRPSGTRTGPSGRSHCQASPAKPSCRLHKGPELDSLLDALPGVVDQVPIMEATGTATIALSTLEAEFPRSSKVSREPRVLLKSDTQGYDAEVLRGAGADGLRPAVRGGASSSWRRSRSTTDQPAMTTVMDMVMDRRVHAGRVRAVLPVIGRAAHGRARRAVHAPAGRGAGLGTARASPARRRGERAGRGEGATAATPRGPRPTACRTPGLVRPGTCAADTRARLTRHGRCAAPSCT